MKRKKRSRFLALFLVLCMLIPNTAYAARGGKGNKRNNNQNDTVQSSTSTDTSSSSSTETELAVVENQDTVENGDMLRAATYELTTTSLDDGVAATADTDDGSTTLKYFPVTMYDYVTDTINTATMAKEESGMSVYNGIYFNDGSPDYTEETVNDLSAFVEGQYYIQNIRAAENGVGSWLYTVPGDTSIRGTANQSDATLWTLVIENGEYYLMAGEEYLIVGTDGDTDGLTETKTAITLSSFSGNSEGVQIGQNGYYLCQWGSNDSIYYGGYNVNNDGGNGMLFYRVDEDEQTLTTLTSTTEITNGYAEWNCWDKASGDNANGQKFYTGLVESTLDANKDITFTKPDGGIFNSDTSVKSIYTNVEMPFVYENGFYTFDASENGVYFYEDEKQSSDGTAASNTRLYFNKGNTQSNGGGYGDGSTTVWAPFNNSTSFSESEMNYHFGMQATIPFTMTANGRINAQKDDSQAIQFSFSGDDDVWVFIDGQLVIDLGGIHNRLDATIDFAANTVTYSESNSLDAETGSYNDSSFKLEQTLFGNLISQDRTTFATTDSHELTIFYLERGKGSSNCKIEFNLPVNDSVTVRKDATQSWSENTKKVSPLTDAEQAIVDNIDFTFTLYQSTDDGDTFEALTNTTYYLLNANGQVVSTPSTDANGKFTLKNGQSAKFITTALDSNATYWVVEDAVSGFTSPDYNYGGEAANGFYDSITALTYTTGSKIPEYEVPTDAETYASGNIKVCGSNESEDSLVFICSNFLDAELPNPSARPADDQIVIDYGLPVQIDVLANDLYRGNKIELVSVAGNGVEVDSESGEIATEGADPVYGTAEIEDGKIVYTLAEQLTGVEVLNYVVKVTGTTTNETTGTEYTACDYAVAKVYIIPATTMYYEENFSDLVTYTGSKWESYIVDSTYQNDYQEPGVVGTVNDGPYGSDVAYLSDSKDSNGTSRYAATSESAVKFSYTFTGTGTSFFARTTNNTGYMKVVVTDSDNKTIQSIYRDTRYLNDDGATLYNIPVFTTDDLDYGTYTVTVTVLKGTDTNGYGTDFWLDGIRVVSPLNSDDENYSIATSAYASDGEANMANVTLRNKLIREADCNDEGELIWSENGNFVVFTDTNGEISTVEEYESIGPKEEVYLNDGQSIRFSLTNWDPNTNKIYLGLKAPFGTGIAIVGNTTINVKNAADCYYEISNCATITTGDDEVKTATFTIKAGSDSLISVTNIKVTGNVEFTIIQNTDDNVEGAEGEDTDD